MRTSVFYRLFGLGKLPRRLLPSLQSEGIVLMDEGLNASVTLRNFRAPGKIHTYRKSGFVGSLVVTERRFAAFSFSRPLINVMFDDERFPSLRIEAEKETVLAVSFSASTFKDGWSGSVACRYRTELARLFVERLAGGMG